MGLMGLTGDREKEGQGEGEIWRRGDKEIDGIEGIELFEEFKEFKEFEMFEEFEMI